MADKEPMDVIKTVLEEAIKELGQNVEQVRPQITFFLEKIQPQVERAVASGDALSLEIIRDRIVGMAGRVSLGFIYKNQQVIVTAIMAAIRTLILLA